MSTLFTKIIDGDIPGVFLWKDEVCVAFMTIGPITPGHALVVPRAEVDQIIDLPEETQGHMMAVAGRIGKAQRAAFEAPRVGMIVAGFEIPHAHLHVFPITSEKDISFANVKPAEGEELAANAEKIRARLIDDGWGEFVPAE